ncbi:MAG: NADP-dependent 3-hydroxy acid dehydrogenase YdfG [Lysobacterales bacterium]|jgi:NADP-dependent 3-hydroxy acid dehydrogenase YdfG
MAYRFANAGYMVAVTDANAERADLVLANIIAAGGAGFSQSLNVTSAQDWDALHQRIDSEWGGLSVLINNAGVAAAGRLEDSSIEDWQWVLDIDLMGVIRGCHQFIPMFRSQHKGHIVNVASFAGMVAVPHLSAYATAKAAVVALSEQIRVDLDRSGVRISVLCPAYVDTRLLETFRSNNEQTRNLASKWMSNSRVSAQQVADKVFDAVVKNRFLILTHPETRWALRFKRWFPGSFHRILVSVSRRITRKLKK